MPLSERAHEVGDVHQTRVPEPTGFDVASTSGSVASYVPPRPVSQPAPSIPAWYRHPKEDIQLLLAVSSSGEVSNVGILKGKGALAYSAKRAAMLWKYQPALANGKPVNSEVIVTVEFLQH
jgi:outer membrane biosynthesis protein TonB